MRMEALLLAALLTAPALIEAFITNTMPVETALLRYLIAAIVCGIALSFLRTLYFGYAAGIPRRRREDAVAAARAEAAAEAGKAPPGDEGRPGPTP